jgi:hypothetical protein
MKKDYTQPIQPNVKTIFFVEHQVIPFHPYRPQDNTFQQLQHKVKLFELNL